MAGRSARKDNWKATSPDTRYRVSGKNREFYTFDNAPGVGAYATGGRIVDPGDGYIYHIFLGDGIFQVTRPSAAIDSIDYLLVGGGGGHGGISITANNGGGGGGGFVFGSISVSNSPGAYPVVVGAGGPASNPSVSLRNGNPTSFGNGSIVAAGGGGGGRWPSVPGNFGGSGGGGTYISGTAGGTGNTPAQIPRQGYDGGAGAGVPGGGSGAGGGAGGVGGNGSTGAGGVGGLGRINPEFPVSVISEAIPSSELPSWSPLVTTLGFAYGSPGGPAPDIRSAPANSGGGGQGNQNSGTGGSGIVCIRYRKNAAYTRATGGIVEPNTHPEHPGVWRHIFTSPGTFEVTDPTLQVIDYLAVGGGGGGGDISPTAGGGGGGGGGGFVTSIHSSVTTPTVVPQAYPWNPGYSVRVGEQYPVVAGTYPVVIGDGGAAGATGSNTTIGGPGASQIIAYGGGGGSPMPGNGLTGGSAGGNASNVANPRPLISAVPSPQIQGNPGGPTATASPVIRNSSGGGGAGGLGGAGVLPPVQPFPGAVGGAGWYSVLSPSSYGTPGPVSGYRYFSGGGGAGGSFRTDVPTSICPGGAGGVGGGGAGGNPPASPPGASAGTPGTANTGGGGGGAGSAGGSGGSGIVIIQYPE